MNQIHEQINRVKDTRPGGRRVPLVLVGNKCDLVAERQVPREVAIGLSRKWGGTPYYEASARKEININEVSGEAAYLGSSGRNCTLILRIFR